MCIYSKPLQDILKRDILYSIRLEVERGLILQTFNIRFPTSYHSDSQALGDCATKPLRVADHNMW